MVSRFRSAIFSGRLATLTIGKYQENIEMSEYSLFTSESVSEGHPDKIADQHIRCMRISLAKDRTLAERKKALKQAVAKFEKERNYSGHIVIDVDPS